MPPQDRALDAGQTPRLAEPPRPVPLLVRLQVLSGGWVNQFGWFFFGFGLVFFWFFVCQADWTSWYRFRGPLATARGHVTASTETRATEGGTKHHGGRRIYKYECAFAVQDREYQCVSYAASGPLQVGHPVMVEYRPGRPAVARILGMRARPFGPGVGFMVLLPLVGLGFVLFGLSRGVRACSLLRGGLLTSARLMVKDATQIRINQRGGGYKDVSEYTFVFKTAQGEVRTASIQTAKTLFQHGVAELLLYDPGQPQRVLLLASLSSVPQIGENGQLLRPDPMAALGCAVLPLVVLLGHGAWALWRLSR